jgi:hypothetical protein
MFVSLGCAAENLIQAALANGLKGNVTLASDAMAATTVDTVAVDTTTVDSLRITLEPTAAISSPFFFAIPKRQCTRSALDGGTNSNQDMKRLEQAGMGDGVRVQFFTGKADMERILEYVVQGNTVQMNDPAFVAELKHWIRFSDAEAVSSGDGLFTRATGNPAMPRWLISPFFKLLFRTKSENDKYTAQIRSSSGIAIFSSARNDKAHWIETGRCYQRFALQATALGIRNAFINQPVEVAALRPQFATEMGLGGGSGGLDGGIGRTDLVVRFGRGAEMPRSLRRPVQDVLV